MSLLRRKVIVGLWLLACAGLCLGQKRSAPQSHPDLSGTWRLDKTRGNYRRYNPEVADGGLTLVVTQAEPEIRIARKFVLEGQERTQALVYYTDGRGEANPTMMTNDLIRTETKWQGRKLVTRFTTRNTLRGVTVDVDTTETWALSADGQTLTVTTSVAPPRGSQPNLIFVPADLEDIKKVFTRVP